MLSNNDEVAQTIAAFEQAKAAKKAAGKKVEEDE